MELLVEYLKTAESASDYEETLKAGIGFLKDHLKDYQTIKNTNETKRFLATKFPEYSEFTEGIVSIEDNNIFDNGDDLCKVDYDIRVMYREKEIRIHPFTHSHTNTSVNNLEILVKIDDTHIFYLSIKKELQELLNLIDLPKKNFIHYVQYMCGYTP